MTAIAPWRKWAAAAVAAATAALITCQHVFPAFAHWMHGATAEYYMGLINGILLCLVTGRLLRKVRESPPGRG